MADEYFIRVRGRVQGPFSWSKLQSMARRGQISRFHELSTDNQLWAKASERKDLFETDAMQAVQGKLARNEDVSYAEPIQDATPSGQWFYDTDNGQDGPVDTATVQNLVRLGKLGPDQQVWCDGMPNWSAVREVPQLAGCIPAGSIAKSFRSFGKLPQLNITSLALIGCAVVLVIFGGAGLMYFDVVPSKLDSNIISSIQQRAKFDDAVGKVVWGWELTLKDGKRYQIPQATGTAFVVSRRGFLLTNKHVVKDFDDMQHATSDARKRAFVASQLKIDENTPADEQKKIEAVRNAFSEEIKSIKPALCVFLHGERYAAKIVNVHVRHDLAIIHSDHPVLYRFRIFALPGDELTDTEVRAVGFPGVATISFSQDDDDKRQIDKKYTNDIATGFDKRELQFFLTAGRISQVTRETSELMWLQHTAELHGGMSGGPLVGTNAVVLGVNTQYATQSQGKVNRSFCLHQLRKEIDTHVPDVLWVD